MSGQQTPGQKRWFDAVMARSFLMDTTGEYVFSPDDTPGAFTYNGPAGQLDTVTYGPDPVTGKTFRQTLTYDDNGNLLTSSGFVLVP